MTDGMPGAFRAARGRVAKAIQKKAPCQNVDPFSIILSFSLHKADRPQMDKGVLACLSRKVRGFFCWLSLGFMEDASDIVC